MERQQSLNTPTHSNNTTPTEETLPPIPIPFQISDFSDLGIDSLVNSNISSTSSTSTPMRRINAAACQQAENWSTSTSSTSSSWLSSRSHHPHQPQPQQEQEGQDQDPVHCKQLQWQKKQQHQFKSPECKRKNRQETWQEIAARIICHTDEFYEKWRHIVTAMNLKSHQDLLQESNAAVYFTHHDESKEFFLRVLLAWACEHPTCASPANLVGYLSVHGFSTADKVREEIHAAAAMDTDTDPTKLKRRSWMQASRTRHLFIGRQSVLLQLHQIVMNAHRPGYTSQAPMTVITGLGGMGKTELVRFYARSFSDYFDGNVFWVTADDKMKMRESFLKLANTDFELDLGQDMSDSDLSMNCYKHFSSGLKRKSLFIFDNAESYADGMNGVSKFLPTTGQLTEESFFDKTPYVILTSRASGLEAWPTNEFQTLELTAWKSTESLDFLRHKLPGSTDVSCERLAEELGHYPLALYQAVGYITSNSSSRYHFNSMDERITNFLELFHFQPQQILNFQPNQTSTGSGYQFTVYKILTIALEKIDVFPRELLTWFVFLGPDKIPVEWFVNSTDADAAGRTCSCDEICDAIDVLKNYSLITIIDEYNEIQVQQQTSLQVHRVVGKLVRGQSVHQDVYTKMIATLLPILAPRIHAVCKSIKENINARLLKAEHKLCVSHAKEFCNHLLSLGSRQQHEQKVFSFNVKHLHSFVRDVWWALDALDYYGQALELAEGFMRLYTTHGVDPTSEQVLSARVLAGRSCLRLDSITAAREHFEAVRESTSAVAAAKTTPLWLEATFHLGWALNRSKKKLHLWNEARKYYTECLDAAEAAAATDNTIVGLRYKLYAISGLANLDRAQYDHLEKSLLQYLEILGTPNWELILDDDERIQFIYQQTALVLKRLEKYDDAVQLLQQNVNRLQCKFGPDSKPTLRAKIKLLEGLLDKRNVDSAQKIVDEIYDKVQEKLGIIHTQTLLLEEYRLKIRELRLLARTDLDEDARVKEWNDIRNGYMAILETKLQDMHLDEDHVLVIHTERSLCEIDAIKGDWDAALNQGKKVLEKQENCWAPGHGDILKMETFLATCETKLRELKIGDDDGGQSDQGHQVVLNQATTASGSASASVVEAAAVAVEDHDDDHHQRQRRGRRSRSTEEGYRCPLCGRVIVRKSDIRRHIKLVHGVQQRYNPDSDNPNLEQGEVPRFRCEKCSASAKRLYQLKGHKCSE